MNRFLAHPANARTNSPEEPAIVAVACVGSSNTCHTFCIRFSAATLLHSRKPITHLLRFIRPAIWISNNRNRFMRAVRSSPSRRNPQRALDHPEVHTLWEPLRPGGFAEGLGPTQMRSRCNPLKIRCLLKRFLEDSSKPDVTGGGRPFSVLRMLMHLGVGPCDDLAQAMVAAA
jgi:hypothetical protein